MNMFLLLALLLVAATNAQERYYDNDDSDASVDVSPEEEYWEYYADRDESADASDDTAGPDPYNGYYTEQSPYTTTQRNIGREWFGFRRYDMSDVVQSHRDGEEKVYTFGEGFDEAIEEKLVPEICYLTSKNYSIYNSYLLDDFLLEQLEDMSPECQSFKCDVVHYAHQHAARIFVDFMNATSMREGVEVVGHELSHAFSELNFCTCGREFFRAIFRAAPFYNANALYTMTDSETGGYYKIMRNVDVKSLGKVFDQLIAGVCASGGEETICLDNIFDVLAELAERYSVTANDWDDYSDAESRKFEKQQEKRCDAFFGVVSAFQKASDYEFDDLDPSDGEYFWEMLFDKLGAGSNALYCTKGCRKQATRLYPCCLRKMMENNKIWDNVVNFIESVYHFYPVIEDDVYFPGFYEMDADKSEEELADWISWTVPDNLREKFMRVVHGAKYCEGKTLRCYN